MGKPNGQAFQELVAFHAAVGRYLRAAGRHGIIIPVREWESMMVKALSRQGVLLTRQSCQDKTWSLERLGLVEVRKREGVIVKEPEQEATV